MIAYCVISGKVVDGAGNPVKNASLIFDTLIPQVVNGQYVQPVVVDTLTGDDGFMIPIALVQGVTVQITVNSAAPFQAVVPFIGAVDFGSLASNAWFVFDMDATTFSFLEDFPPISGTSGEIGTNRWTVFSMGGTPAVSPLTAEDQHPGIIEIGTAATTNAAVALSASGSNAWQLTYGLLDYTNWKSSVVFRLNTLTNVKFLTGWVNDWTTYPALHYWGIRFDTSLGDVNFMFVSSDGGGANMTVIDTGIPGDSAWHTLRMMMAAPEILLFSLDNGKLQTITDINSLPGFGLTPAVQLVTLENAQKTADLDYFSLAVPSLTR